ncbi:dUTP diphosphatase [Salicibibacter halophilus]|nr:dUTP diphosphatase [Salicibibacter halophilus]
MDLQKLLETQRELDESIIEKHNLQGMDRLPFLFQALIVELGEVQNDWRGFKFWSNDPNPREGLLEEYVDVTHFFLSIAIHQGWEKALFLYEEQVDGAIEEVEAKEDVSETFIELNNMITESYMKRESEEKIISYTLPEYFFRMAWGVFLAIGKEAFGFTLEQVEEAYFEKNQVNHERQANGY